METIQLIGRVASQPFRGSELRFKKVLLTGIALGAISYLISALPGVGTLSLTKGACSSLVLLAAGYYSFPSHQEIKAYSGYLEKNEFIVYRASLRFGMSHPSSDLSICLSLGDYTNDNLSFSGNYHEFSTGNPQPTFKEYYLGNSKSPNCTEVQLSALKARALKA